jgi:uncharacterized protein (TIGR03118 family)
MHHVNPYFIAAMVIAIAAGATAPVRADDGEANSYVVTPLVSDLPGAPVQDTNLKNAWGVAFSPAGSPFWVADNATGQSTLYEGDGTIFNITGATPVKIPGPSGPGTGTPTGIVWNPSAAFLVPGTATQAAFIFDTEDGTISAWARGLATPDQAVLAATTPGAVYKGLAFGVNKDGAFLFATNFRAGTIDVFDHNYMSFTASGGFADPKIPAGYAPFGIQNINGNLFVTYAKQDAAKHDDAAGPGRGFVDVFDTDGHLLRRLASRGALNSPWGVARASFAFGKFSDDILIGNFGDGRINVVSSDGSSLEPIRDGKGKPITIDGLWTLTLGGGMKSSPSTLYFTAGPNGESDGLFGTITPVSKHR